MKKVILSSMGIILGIITFSFIHAHDEKVEEVNKVNKHFKFI